MENEIKNKFVSRMNAQVKQKWIDALRSGKYQQGRLCLKSNKYGYEEYCCLGVLCDLHAKETGNNWSGSSYMRASVIQPIIVTKWAGFTGMDGYPDFLIAPHLSPVGANDNMGYDFNKIADLIEENVEGV